MSAPALYFLTVHGETAVLTDAGPGAGAARRRSVASTARRQITVAVPHSDWNPGTPTVRLAAGVGLWNQRPAATCCPGPTASATQPGGAGADTVAARLLRRRLPLQRPGAAAGHPEPGNDREPRLVARVRAGAGARER